MISHNQCKRELKTLSGKEAWLNNYPQINAYKLKLQYFAFEPYFFGVVATKRQIKFNKFLFKFKIFVFRPSSTLFIQNISKCDLKINDDNLTKVIYLQYDNNDYYYYDKDAKILFPVL